MMDPGQFSLAVSLAGYYTALEDDTTGNLYGSSDGYRSLNSPDWRLTHLPAPPVSVLVASSKIGEKTYPGTLQFLKLVKPPMRAYSLFLPQGGHNFVTWGRELPQSLEWLSARLRPAHPAGPADDLASARENVRKQALRPLPDTSQPSPQVGETTVAPAAAAGRIAQSQSPSRRRPAPGQLLAPCGSHPVSSAHCSAAAITRSTTGSLMSVYGSRSPTSAASFSLNAP